MKELLYAVIPFCTHGGGGFGHMLEDYKRECGASHIKTGIALKGDYSFDELQKWLETSGVYRDSRD